MSREKDLRGVRWLPKKTHRQPSAYCRICLEKGYKRIAYYQNSSWGHATLDIVTMSHDAEPERVRDAGSGH